MYKLPDDITNIFLKDDVVKMICFNINQIYIHFESSIYITIDSRYILTQKGIDRPLDVYPVISDSGLLSLLEKKVKRISISDLRHDINIYFEDNLSIKLMGNLNYESYSITIKDRRIII